MYQNGHMSTKLMEKGIGVVLQLETIVFKIEWHCAIDCVISLENHSASV